MRGLCCIMQERAYKQENKLCLLSCLLRDYPTEISSSLPQQEYKYCSTTECNFEEELLTGTEMQDACDDNLDCRVEEDLYEVGASDNDDDICIGNCTVREVMEDCACV